MNAALDALVMHAGCEEMNCRICMSHDLALYAALEAATEDFSRMRDLRGEYHSWLGRQGLPAETDGGWWSREALSDANVQRFAQRGLLLAQNGRPYGRS